MPKPVNQFIYDCTFTSLGPQTTPMNAILTFLNIISLVYASCAEEAASIFEITGSDDVATGIGAMMAPILFQNGFEKCMMPGHSGSLNNGKWYFTITKTLCDTTFDHCSQLEIAQSILIYTPEALAKKKTSSYQCFPSYEITHKAKYRNVLDSFNERSNCKLHVFTLKSGKIEVFAITNDY